MNETTLIEKTVKGLKNKDLRLTEVKYGSDSSGTRSVWIYFSVKNKESNQKELIKKINHFSTELKENLLKNGLDSWPYVSFHGAI